MTRDDRRRRIERWYSPQWWERYGEELMALLEDCYADGPLPWSARWSLAREGLSDRARRAGLVGHGASREQRWRAGALYVLVAWAMVVGAGSLFAKVIDNWQTVTPTASRPFIDAVVVAAQIGAALGAVAFVGACAVSRRAVTAFARERGARESWRRLRSPLLAVIVAVASTAVIVSWAHRLSAAQRGGADASYEVGFVVWVALLLVCLGLGARGLVRIVARLEYREAELVRIAQLCAGATGALVALVVSELVWWVSMARVAPGFFSSSTASAYALPALSVSVVVLTAALVLAVVGLARIRDARREGPRPLRSRAE